MSSTTTITLEHQQYLSHLAALDSDGWSVSLDALKQVAASTPPPLIEDLLPSKAVVTFAGTPGIGKSFVALSWAAAVAGGVPWFDKAVQNPQYVAYVLGEGYSHFGKRVEAWEQVYGPMSRNLRFIDGASQGMNLADPQNVDDLIEKLRAMSPGLVIFDTFAMLAQVKSENDNSQVSEVFRAAHRIVQMTNATVVIVHHTTKDSGLVRGATAFRGNADTVIVASEATRKDDPTFELSTRGEENGKQRDGLPIKLDGFEVSAPGVLTRSKNVAKQRAASNDIQQIMQRAAPDFSKTA